MAAQNNGNLTATGYLAVAGSGVNDASKTKPATDNFAVFGLSGASYTGLSFVFEIMTDGLNWGPVAAIDLSTSTWVSGTISPTNGAVNSWLVPCLGATNVRMRVTAITGGTASINADSSAVNNQPLINNLSSTTPTTFAGDVTIQGLLYESNASGITAGTTRTQAGATALTKEVNRVTVSTAPAAGTVLGDGVALMAAKPGLDATVINATTNPIQVYSLNGGTDTINGIAGSTGVAIPPGDVAQFECATLGIWNYEPAMGANGQLVAELAADSVTANASGTQSGATVLPIAEMIHVITAANTAAPYSSVSIPVAALPGTEIYIENNAANPFQLFPINGGTDQINGLGANNSIVVPVSATVIVACTLSGSWVSNPYYNAVGALPGNIPTQMGASIAATGSARPGGTINSPAFSVAGQGNGADATDDVILTFALPANILDVSGRQINISAIGKFAGNGNNKRIKVWWGTTTQNLGAAVAGGTLIADSGVVTTNGGGWNLTAQGTKYGANGSNTQVGQGAIVAGGTHTGTVAPVTLTSAENGVINVTITGSSPTSSAANDVVGQMLVVGAQN